MKTVLTIACSDCSGGSGLQADLKTFTMHDTFGMSVVLGVVAVNTVGVYGVQMISPELAQQQFDAVFSDIPPQALKTGMLANSTLIELTIENFKKYQAKNIVIDPVMFAKSGAKLMADSDFELYKKDLLSFADVLTPNKKEAELLTGINICDKKSLKDAAMKLVDMGAKSVIAKGGKYYDDAVDIFYDGKEFYELKSTRLKTISDHGAGCTLSAAIAANLALGKSVLDAVKNAKEFTHQAMFYAPNLGGGRGPMRHSFKLMEKQ